MPPRAPKPPPFPPMHRFQAQAEAGSWKSAEKAAPLKAAVEAAVAVLPPGWMRDELRDEMVQSLAEDARVRQYYGDSDAEEDDRRLQAIADAWDSRGDYAGSGTRRAWDRVWAHGAKTGLTWGIFR